MSSTERELGVVRGNADESPKTAAAAVGHKHTHSNDECVRSRLQSKEVALENKNDQAPKAAVERKDAGSSPSKSTTSSRQKGQATTGVCDRNWTTSPVLLRYDFPGHVRSKLVKSVENLTLVRERVGKSWGSFLQETCTFSWK